MIRLDGGGAVRRLITDLDVPVGLEPWVEAVSAVTWPRALHGRRWIVVPDVSAHVLVHCDRGGHRTASVVGARTTSARFAMGSRRWTVAVRLRPGAIPCLVSDDATTLTDRSVRLAEIGLDPGSVLDAGAPNACADALIAALGRALEGCGTPDWRVRGLVAASRTAPARGPRVRDTARSMGVSERTLRGVVRRETGLGPGALLRIGRMLGAAERIVSSSEDLSSIAHRSGFADHAHFTHEFRRLMGEPPSRYRRRGSTIAEFDKRGWPQA